MPELVRQKRDETIWGGSVRVALGEGDRLVGMPLVKQVLMTYPSAIWLTHSPPGQIPPGRSHESFKTCVQGQTCYLRAVSVLATSYGSHTHHCMPGLAQQKRDETTWEGSVRVALGEGDRLVGMPLVTTPEDCIHTSHV